MPALTPAWIATNGSHPPSRHVLPSCVRALSSHPQRSASQARNGEGLRLATRAFRRARSSAASHNAPIFRERSPPAAGCIGVGGIRHHTEGDADGAAAASAEAWSGKRIGEINSRVDRVSGDSSRRPAPPPLERRLATLLVELRASGVSSIASPLLVPSESPEEGPMRGSTLASSSLLSSSSTGSHGASAH